jgi:hypothetical protein
LGRSQVARVTKNTIDITREDSNVAETDKA